MFAAPLGSLRSHSAQVWTFRWASIKRVLVSFIQKGTCQCRGGIYDEAGFACVSCGHHLYVVGTSRFIPHAARKKLWLQRSDLNRELSEKNRGIRIHLPQGGTTVSNTVVPGILSIFVTTHDSGSYAPCASGSACITPQCHVLARGYNPNKPLDCFPDRPLCLPIIIGTRP